MPPFYRGDIVTKNQKIWEKETKRLEKWLQQMQKKGYVFTGYYIIPEKPKRITNKQLQNIKSITPKILKSYLAWYDESKQQWVYGNKAVKAQRDYSKKIKLRESARKEINKLKDTAPQEADIVIQNFVNLLDSFEPDVRWSNWLIEIKLKQISQIKWELQQAIKTQGKSAVAKKIQDNAKEIYEIAEKIMYDSKEESVQHNLLRLHELINNDITIQDRIKDSETMEYYNEG